MPAPYSFTQTQIDVLATNARCCYVTEMSIILDLIKIGDNSWISRWYYATLMKGYITSLFDYLITEDCVENSQICTIIQTLEQFCSQCGCVGSNSTYTYLLSRP